MGLLGEGYGAECLVFNIHSQLFGYYSQKNIFCKRSSTLPPLHGDRCDNQAFAGGGIMVELWVELHEVPPIIPP